jgi:predicted DNA-binding transcriptional regulator AlpA
MTDMSVTKLSPLDDEWWTTAMVCAYLKLGKRALWDIRCNPSKDFPKALKPGGKVNLFRALDVRAWLENRSAGNSTTPPKTPAKKHEPPPAPPEPLVKPPSTMTAATPPRRGSKRKSEADSRQLALF